MSSFQFLLLAIGGLAWAGWAAACRVFDRHPRGGDDGQAGLAWGLVQLWVRLVHRLRVEGLEHVPRWSAGDPPVGPLVIVANHSAGIDPLLIQAACGYDVRWMMMRAMMAPALAGLWDWAGVIPVEQDGRDTRALRAAVRHLESGGVVGVFPEGSIARPARTVMPFLPGAGLLIAKTDAQVLIAVVDGTPMHRSAFASLVTPSRARVWFLPPVSFAGTGRTPAQIAGDLRARISGALGWAMSPRESGGG